jgi:hypothetical protein
MSLDSEKAATSIRELRRRKRVSRNYVRNMSPTEKILQLEELQERCYELMEIREQNGGLPVPDNWKRWRKAQKDLAIKK